MTRTKARYIDTTWEIRTYDVWGNARDGYEVNDTFVDDRAYPLRLKVVVNNAGTPHEFESAHPTEPQLREALHLKRIALDLDGDDLTIYVNHATDGYPCGELRCTSHTSLSPIKPRA